MSNKKAIKVLFIIDTLHGYGAERSIVEIAKNFTSITPIFVSVYEDGILSPELEACGIKLYSLKINKKNGFNYAVNKIEDIYNKEKPEIVHATLYKSEIIARKLKMKIPEIILIGSLINNVYAPGRYSGINIFQKLKLAYYHFVDRSLAKNVDYFISNSNSIKKIYQKALNIPQNRVMVIHRGRDPRQFSFIDKKIEPDSGLRSENFLLNIGRLIPSKGQKDIIEVMPDILKKYPKTTLKIAGHGSMLNELEEQIKKYNLEQEISILGEVNEVLTLLSEASLFIFPSYSEGLSGALIEAMMSGCTIIVSDIPENLECVGEDGAYIYSSGNLTELKEKIIYAIEHPEESFSKAQAAKERAMQKFDILRISKQYEEFYTKITS